MDTCFNIQKHKKQMRRRGIKFMMVVNCRIGEVLRPKIKINFMCGVPFSFMKQRTSSVKSS